MKKLLSVVLALAMVLALGVTAFADSVTVTDPTTDGNQTFTDGSYTKSDITVGATYAAGANAVKPDAVYSVNITWNVENPTYTGGQDKYEWNAESLQYVKTDGTGSWKNGSVTITVANRSDAIVKAGVTFADGSDDISAAATWTSKTNNAEAIEYTTGTVDIPSAAVDSSANAIEYTNTTSSGTQQVVVFAGEITVDENETIAADANNIGTITITLTK